MRDTDQVFGLRCATDGERAGSGTKFNPGEPRPAFSPLTRVTRLRAWTANDGRTIKAFATAWYSMEQEFDAGLHRRGHCLSVDSSLSEKEKFNAESAQLHAGKTMTLRRCLIPECTMPDAFGLIAMRSCSLSRSHNDLALPSLSNGSPTVIEFAKAGASLLPSFNASEQPSRGHMWSRYESTKAPTLSGGLVPADMVTRTLEIVDMGTPSDNDVPRPSMDTSLFRHCADDEKVVLGYLFLHVDNVMCRLLCARARQYRSVGSKKVEQDWVDLGRGLTLLIEM